MSRGLVLGRLRGNDPKNPVVTIIQPTEALKREAQRLGFVLCGVTPAAEPARIAALRQWIASGYAGEMKYLEERSAAYAHPNHVLQGCRSVVMLAMPYRTESAVDAAADDSSAEARAEIASYALGTLDYHDWIHDKLKELKAWVLAEYPEARVRGVVDTAPLLEREFAEAAGLGWVGKNTLLLNRTWGSYFFLAALLTDLELQYDPPQEKGYCGTCTACLDACPTGAFVAPYVLDARRCLSYLTIEHRGEIEEALALQFDRWIFGCDICQEVCPWNRKAAVSHEAAFEPQQTLVDLSVEAVLRLSESEFRERFRHTPMWRTKRRGMIRNAILLAVGKQLRECLPLIQQLSEDDEPIIRQAAVWALRKLR